MCMPQSRSTKDERLKVDLGDLELDLKKSVRYQVVLDGVRAEVETPASFALKFSLLANLPVTKVKHLMRSLPAVMWTGKRKSQALSLLNLIEEAGGSGRVVEEEYAPDMEHVAGEKSTRGKVCPKCGFPIKKEDLFCNFCMTPVDEGERQSLQVTVPCRRGSSAAYRYLFLILLGVAALILVLFLRG